MCWGDEGFTKDYFYLKDSFYYITGSRDLFKGILESKFESEIEEILAQDNNLKKRLYDAIPRGDYDCLLLFFDEATLTDLSDTKTIVLGKKKEITTLKKIVFIKIIF